MAVIKLEALRYLRERLECEIPALVGHICVGQSPPNHNLCFPSLDIIPAGSWRFIPDQEGDEVFEPAPDRVVCRIGRWEATLQLQLVAATQEQRYQLEQDVEQAFMTEGHPGILFGDVKACEEDFGVFEASFMLEGDEWQDGKAFAGQSWSFVEIQASIPALATRRGAYTMDEIRLGLTEVFGTTITPSTFGTDDDIERVLINDDGTITPL